MSFRGLLLSCVFLLTACMDGVQGQEKPAGVDATEITDVTDVTELDAAPAPNSAEATTAPEARQPPPPEASSEGDEGARQALDMSLKYQSDENANYLFADKEETPNYFRSRSTDEGVKLKGKLYMIEEPTAEKRMQNIDGGEIGVTVPLR